MTTDSPNMPERLWAVEDSEHEIQWWIDPDEGGTEYVRADLCRPDRPPAGEVRLAEVNRIANIMIAEWNRVDPKSNVAQHPASYIANFADMARAVLAALSPAPAPSGWRDISTAPHGKTVLVSIVNRAGNRVTVKAVFWPEFTQEQGAESEMILDYDEASDTYYAPEGWYEDVWSETGLEYSYIMMDETPTHWMPLPPAPGAEPAPAPEREGLAEQLRSYNESWAMGVTLKEAADALDAKDARIAELEAALDSHHAEVGSNIWRFWSDKATAFAQRNAMLYGEFNAKDAEIEQLKWALDKSRERQKGYAEDALRHQQQGYAKDAEIARLRDEARILCEVRPEAEWHEDDGPVLWHKFPINEAPWVGTPLDSDWPGYHTDWTPLPPVPEQTF